MQQIGRELLPVEITRRAEGALVSMDQAAPRFGAVVENRSELAASLGIGIDELAAEDAVVISTGAGHHDADAYARFFNPTMGIGEDPATGTAAGPLAARLGADGVIPDGSTVVVEQCPRRRAAEPAARQRLRRPRTPQWERAGRRRRHPSPLALTRATAGSATSSSTPRSPRHRP